MVSFLSEGLFKVYIAPVLIGEGCDVLMVFWGILLI
jgi:hypothetical protein